MVSGSGGVHSEEGWPNNRPAPSPRANGTYFSAASRLIPQNTNTRWKEGGRGEVMRHLYPATASHAQEGEGFKVRDQSRIKGRDHHEDGVE